MDRIRRNERLAAMTRILTESPNKIFTLGTLCELFGAAKSTLSEDIDILRGVFSQFHLGQLDTVTGAAGGVRYRPVPAPEDAFRCVRELAQMLAAPGRVLQQALLVEQRQHLDRRGAAHAEARSELPLRIEPLVCMECARAQLPRELRCNAAILGHAVQFHPLPLPYGGKDSPRSMQILLFRPN